MAKKNIVNTDISVNPNSTYEVICKTVGNHSFGSVFSRKLIEELSRYYFQKEIAALLKYFTKGASIVNKETFLSTYKIGVGDIGHEAWRYCKGDIEEFVPRVIMLMELHKQRGESQIDLSSVLFYLAQFRGYRTEHENKKWKVYAGVKAIAAATVSARFNPFVIQVVHPQLCQDIIEKLDLPNVSMYRNIVGTFIDEYDKIYERDLCVSRSNPSLTFPKLKFAIPVEHSPRKSQILCLASVFALPVDTATKEFKEILNLAEPSVELFSLFDRIKEKKGLTEVDNRAVIRKLQKIEERGKLLTYPKIKDYHRYFCYKNNSELSLKAIKKYNVESNFVDKESFIQDPFNDAAKIEIDCDKLLNISQIEPFVDAAAKVIMAKVRKVGINKFPMFNGLENPKLLIQLYNVTQYTLSFSQEIRTLEKKLQDTYMKNFRIQVQYSEATARSRFGEGDPKYIRVISDIHADVNRDQGYIFDFGDDFVINCGDTASNVHEERAWIRTFMQDGIAIAGNHLGYTSDKPELDGDSWSNNKFGSSKNVENTYNSQIEKLIDLFPQTGTIRYLSNGMVEINDIIFIGTTLYTDFKLFGEDNQAACMMEAARGMNDFKFRYSLEKNEWGTFHITPFSVERHAKLFAICKGYIKNRLKYLKNHSIRKPVVIITHHCPLPMCISDEYKNSPLSAAFASDMTDLLEEYPTIRLWCSGHVHAPYDFLYNQTRFVAEPWGYFNENGFDIENYGKRILVDDVKAVKRSWRTLLKDELKFGIVKDYGYSPNYTGVGANLIKKCNDDT